MSTRIVAGMLMAIVVVFIVIRLANDIPNVTSGAIPPAEQFDHRYATYPWLANFHILPGPVYLLLAPIQLWRAFATATFAGTDGSGGWRSWPVP